MWYKKYMGPILLFVIYHVLLAFDMQKRHDSHKYHKSQSINRLIVILLTLNWRYNFLSLEKHDFHHHARWRKDDITFYLYKLPDIVEAKSAWKILRDATHLYIFDFCSYAPL